VSDSIFFKILGVAGILIAFMYVNNARGVSQIEAQRQHDQYCHMVSIWNSQSHLLPEHRNGWPPFRGECE